VRRESNRYSFKYWARVILTIVTLVDTGSELQLPWRRLLAQRVTSRQWLWGLGALSLLSFAIRLGSVLGRINRKPGGDVWDYFHSATLLVEGKGFINPWIYYGTAGHPQVYSANFAPLFTMVMAVPQFFGIESYLAARIWFCLVGTGAVIVVAYAGREIGGRRIGLIAGLLLAIYPNIWMATELTMSETLVPLLVGWFLFQVYRFWREPTTRNVVLLGLSLGVTILGRDELALLAVLVVVPLVLMMKNYSWKQRMRFLLVGLATTTLILAPWVIRNNIRFQNLTLISTRIGITNVATNCDATYNGSGTGYWSYGCVQSAAISPFVDESVANSHYAHVAYNYISQHLGELPRVEEARLGRVYGFYNPIQQIQLDAGIETRPYNWALTGLGMYYAFVVMSIGGTIALRRRKVTSFPLWAIAANVAIATMLTFGDTRYRISFDVSLVLMSAVFLEWALRKTFRWEPEDYVFRRSPSPAEKA